MYFKVIFVEMVFDENTKNNIEQHGTLRNIEENQALQVPFSVKINKIINFENSKYIYLFKSFCNF